MKYADLDMGEGIDSRRKAIEKNNNNFALIRENGPYSIYYSGIIKIDKTNKNSFYLIAKEDHKVRRVFHYNSLEKVIVRID